MLPMPSSGSGRLGSSHEIGTAPLSTGAEPAFYYYEQRVRVSVR